MTHNSASDHKDKSFAKKDTKSFSSQKSSKTPSKQKNRRHAPRVHDVYTDNIYQQLIEQAADGILTTDLKGVICYVNKAAGAILHQSAAQLLNKHFRFFLSRDSIPKARQYFGEVKRGVSVIRDELHVIDSRGEKLPIEFTSTPIFRDGKIYQIHISMRDISERKMMDKYIRETEKQKALQHFITGTALEIQQPLKSLFEHSQALIEKYRERDFEYIGYKEFREILDRLELMRDQSLYCFQTARRLNDLQKKKIGLGENCCQVRDVIQEAVKTVRQDRSRHGIKILTRFSKELPLASIGAIELNQVVTNLITNAIQSINGQGTILIKTIYSRKKDMIRIDFVDDGAGIDKDNLPRVFDPFFSTKHRGLHKNSGLGLSIVQSIVQDSNGNIEIKSSLRDGTQVRVFLPVAESC